MGRVEWANGEGNKLSLMDRWHARQGWLELRPCGGGGPNTAIGHHPHSKATPRHPAARHAALAATHSVGHLNRHADTFKEYHINLRQNLQSKSACPLNIETWRKRTVGGRGGV